MFTKIVQKNKIQNCKEKIMDGITFKSSDNTMSVPTCFFEAHPEQLAKLMSTFFGLRPVAKLTGNSMEAIYSESIVTGLDKIEKMQEEFNELKTSLMGLLPGNSGNGDLEKDKESRKEVKTISVVSANKSIEPNNDDSINDDQEKEEVSIEFCFKKDNEQDKLSDTESYDSYI